MKRDMIFDALTGAPDVEVIAPAQQHALTRFLPDVERMAAQGMDGNQIARRLRMSPADFYAMAKRYPDIEQAMQYGLAKGVDELSHMLFTAATKGGDVNAAKFLLERRGGYVPPVLQLKDDGLKPQFSLDAPSPVSLDAVEAAMRRQAEFVRADLERAQVARQAAQEGQED